MAGRNRVGQRQFVEENRARLAEMLKDYLVSEDKGNSYMMRFHRCYIDGSYGSYNNEMTGENLYKMHLGQVTRNNGDSAWRRIAITTLKGFIAIEFYQREHMPTNQETEDLLDIVLKEHKDEFIDGLISNLKGLAE